MSSFLITELNKFENRVKAQYIYKDSESLIEHIKKLQPKNSHSLTDYNVNLYKLYVCFLGVSYLLETQIIDQEDIYFSVNLPGKNFVKISKLYNKVFNLNELHKEIDLFEKSCFDKAYSKDKIWVDSRNDYQYTIKSFVTDNETNSLMILCNSVSTGNLFVMKALDWDLHFLELNLSTH